MASASMGFSHHLLTATSISSSVLAMFGTSTGADGSLPGISDMIKVKSKTDLASYFVPPLPPFSEPKRRDPNYDKMAWLLAFIRF